MTPLHSAISNNQEVVAVMLIEEYNASPTKTDYVRADCMSRITIMLTDVMIIMIVHVGR